MKLRALLAGVACFLAGAALAAEPPNPNIDMQGFLKVAAEAARTRDGHRVSEADFIRMAKEPGTVVLDARSGEMYRLLHVAGAVNLSFPDFTADDLARVLGSPGTRVLIYCNNNFVDSPAFRTKLPSASLNLSTFVALRDYGYRNVYELGPLLDPRTSRIAFEGASLSSP